MKKCDSNLSIDFVLLWVDEQDKKWMEQKNRYWDKYRTLDTHLNGNERYRDYGLLKYWFRMVATNAPWVNHIFLVTNNELPKWLNVSNPKLTIVRHEEFMPASDLPTFNSNSIQMYIHKIKGLSEKFILFDDDMFINKPIKPSIFFNKQGLPRDTLALNLINPVDQFAHIFVNNLVLINKNYRKKDLLQKNFFKLFNWRYGFLNFVSLYLVVWPSFTRFYDTHLPYAYLKSQYSMVMKKFKNQQSDTGHHKFREVTDISHWIVRYERLVNGDFVPITHRIGKLIYLGDKIPENKLIFTVGDREMSQSDFEKKVMILQTYFKKKYSKSDFEV